MIQQPPLAKKDWKKLIHQMKNCPNKFLFKFLLLKIARFQLRNLFKWPSLSKKPHHRNLCSSARLLWIFWKASRIKSQNLRCSKKKALKLLIYQNLIPRFLDRRLLIQKKSKRSKEKKFSKLSLTKCHQALENRRKLFLSQGKRNRLPLWSNLLLVCLVQLSQS